MIPSGSHSALGGSVSVRAVIDAVERLKDVGLLRQNAMGSLTRSRKSFKTHPIFRAVRPFAAFIANDQ